MIRSFLSKKGAIIPKISVRRNTLTNSYIKNRKNRIRPPSNPLLSRKQPTCPFSSQTIEQLLYMLKLFLYIIPPVRRKSMHRLNPEADELNQTITRANPSVYRSL
ncbi:MAG: hypothetical protein ABIL68_12875, partial [bacterium]